MEIAYYAPCGLLFIYTIILLKSVCLSVGVRKMQVAILARSSREMPLTVRIVWQYIYPVTSSRLSSA